MYRFCNKLEKLEICCVIVSCLHNILYINIQYVFRYTIYLCTHSILSYYLTLSCTHVSSGWSCGKPHKCSPLLTLPPPVCHLPFADFEFILIRFYFLLIFITFSYISFDFALVVSTLNYLLFVFLVARACSMRQKGNKMSNKKKREKKKRIRNIQIKREPSAFFALFSWLWLTYGSSIWNPGSGAS